jgi:hypothetical protein
VSARPDNATLNGRPQAVSLLLEPSLLRPLIQEIVAEVLAALEEDRANVPDKLAYSEAESARLISLNVHQLRDMRLRGEITASRIVGGRIRYTRQDLVNYLLERRVNGGPE